MTLQPQSEFSIPEETMRVARAAYPKGNIYMKMRDALREPSTRISPSAICFRTMVALWRRHGDEP